MLSKCDKCKIGNLEPVDLIDSIKKDNREFNIYVCVCNNCSESFYIDLKVGGNDNEN